MENSKKDKKDKKPAVSTEEILQILTTAPMQEEAPQEKTFLDGEGFDWSPEEEEEEAIKLWLKGERLQYEDEKGDKTSS